MLDIYNDRNSYQLIYNILSNVHDLHTRRKREDCSYRLYFIQRQFQSGCTRSTQLLIQVLGKTNMSKTFGQYVTANYSFYTFVKENFVFLVMVESAVYFL